MNVNTVDLLPHSQNSQQIIQIQSWSKGCMYRLQHLPIVLYVIREILRRFNIQFSDKHGDGRVNSCMDEEPVISILVEKLGDRIKIPEIRKWYDIMVRDYRYGWIPVNIKTTKMNGSSDNSGSIAICVQAYTDHELELNHTNECHFEKMSDILITKLLKREYNKRAKKDYYFLVLNKCDSSDIIINSVKGLNVLSPNANNLPFQINWSKNREFTYRNVRERIRQFIRCYISKKQSSRERFIANMRNMDPSSI